MPGTGPVRICFLIDELATAGTETQLLALPGVIEAEIFLRAGDSTGDLLGAMTHAAYIFCVGDTAEEAEKFADNALSSCQITVDAGS